MYFVGGLPTNIMRHDYIFEVVDWFIKTCILMTCKKAINTQEETNKFFEKVWVHFGIPRSIISYKDTIFIIEFRTTL